MTRVLYIDDDPRMIETIGSHLSETGHHVASEIGGAEGLRRFRSEGADIVLLDLLMPGMSGLEVLAAIRQSDPDVPVVVLTGGTEGEDAAAALRMGACGCLVKPIPDVSIIDHAIRRELERRELERNIRSRDRVEAELREALREREALLKDIHHRVKNNLQIISSLLSLQANFISDPGSLQMFRRSLNRIRSMTLVHEELYRSESLSSIDFRRYAESLTGYLFQFYEVPDRVRRVLDVERIFLPIQTAIPCGLIIGELVTNAISFAFPDERPGAIGVGLRREGDRMRLSVWDDGVGIPPDIDIARPTSLGLQLLVNLASQLRGTLELDRSSGSRISVLILPE